MTTTDADDSNSVVPSSVPGASGFRRVSYRESFGCFSYVAIALFVMTFGLPLLADLKSARGPNEEADILGEFIGTLLSSLFVAILLSYCAFLLFRRSRFASKLVFVGAMLLIIAVVASSRVREQQRLEDIQAGVLQEVQVATSVFESEIGSVYSAGGNDPATLKTIKEIDGRIAGFRRLEDANARVIEEIESVENRLREELEQQSFSNSEIRKAVQQLRTADLLTLSLELRRSDVRALAAIVEQLEVLRNQFGKWIVDNDGSIQFLDDRQRARYQEAVLVEVEENERQDQLQRDALDAIQKLKEGEPN